MGVVHLGQRASGERAAIKVLRPHVVSDDEARARLAREVNSLSRVRSSRVAEIVDADPWGEIPYVATRYVPGLPLHRHVQEEGALAGADLRHFAIGLAEALRAVHGVGVLHRDIKPSNVLMEGRNPVLIDFGLARLDDDMKVTRTGYLLGTPGYLAPEILFGAEPTVASDIHSWAATVAYAGTGRPPFGSGHALTVMDRVRRGEHDLSGLDPSLHLLILGALDADPTRRPSLDSVLRSLGAPGDPAPAGDIPMTLPFAAMPTAAPAGESAPTGGVRVTPGPGASGPTEAQPVSEAAAPTLQQPPSQPTAQHAGSWPPPQPRPTPMAPPARAPHQQPPPVARAWQQASVPAPAAQQQVGTMERIRRGVVGVLGIGALAAATALAPWATFVLAAVVVCVVRAGSTAAQSLTRRRASRGAKWHDPVLVAVTAPWHVAISLVGSAVLVAWAAVLSASLLVVLVALGAADHLAFASAGAVVAVALWTGPGAPRVRTPLRRLVLPACASLLAWALTAAVLLLASALMYAGATASVQWWPAEQAPWAGGTWLGKWL